MPRGISSNGHGGRYIDIANERFGRLVAVRDAGRDRHKNRIWLCRCDCGTEKLVTSVDLRSGHTQSCGCLMRESASQRKLSDLTGRRFGRLTVLAQGGRSNAGKVLWMVKCDCGTEKTVVGADIRSGRTQSCGCQRVERATANTTHGLSKSPEYRAWASMIARCTYETATGYENYGARGIAVCARWRGSFEAFYADMGPRPSPSHSLDRYPNVNGHYEPGNVRWATASDQARNKRSTVTVTIGDETKSLAEWCEIRGLVYRTVHDRMNKLGWSPEESLGFKERAA